MSQGLQRSTSTRRRRFLVAAACGCLVLAGALVVSYRLGVFSQLRGSESDADVQGLRPNFNAGVLQRVEERLAPELQVVRALGLTREEMDAVVRTAEDLRRGDISAEEARERLRQRGIGPDRIERAIKQLQTVVKGDSDAP